MTYDETPLERKENCRLSQRIRSLRDSQPDKTIKINKGKLLVDNEIVDQFDIKNSVF